MIKYFIYGAIILLVLWKGRLYIKGFFSNYKTIKKFNDPTPQNDVTFVPVETKKTYVFAIELEEIGNGKAKLSIIKPLKYNEDN